MAFTNFPIPTRRAHELPTIASLSDNEHFVAATEAGFRRIVKTAVGTARIYVTSTTPTGERTSQDFWIQPGESPAVMRWWNGSEWQVTTYVPNKENLEALLELGDAATFDTGTAEGEIPIIGAGGKLGTGLLPAITNALLAEMPANRMKGRIGTSGVPQDLTPSQVRTVAGIGTAEEIRTLAGLGTAAVRNTGTSADNVPVLGSDGKLSLTVLPSSAFLNNTVFIRGQLDLPDIQDGVRPLEENTTYLIDGQVVLADPLLIENKNNVAIIGLNPANDGIVFTGTGPAIQSVNSTLFLNRFYIAAPSNIGLSFVSDEANDMVNVSGAGAIGANGLYEWSGTRWENSLDNGFYFEWVSALNVWYIRTASTVFYTGSGGNSSNPGTVTLWVGNQPNTSPMPSVVYISSTLLTDVVRVSGAGSAVVNGDYFRDGQRWVRGDYEIVLNSLTELWNLNEISSGDNIYEGGSDGVPWTDPWVVGDLGEAPAPSVQLVEGGLSPKFLNCEWVSFVGCAQAIDLFTVNAVTITKCLFRNNGIGAVFDGGINKVFVDACFFEGDLSAAGNAQVLFPDTALINDIDINASKFEGDVGKFIEIEDTASLLIKGTLINNRFRGDATSVEGVDFSTAKWTLRDNSGVENTRITAHMWFTGNDTATTITTLDEWVKIGIATSANSLAGFTHTSPNKLTYTRDLPLSVKVLASLDVEAPSNNQRCEVAVFKNGTIVASTAREIELNTQNISKAVTINTRVEVEQDDELELYIRNRTGTADLTVNSLAVTV